VDDDPKSEVVRGRGTYNLRVLIQLLIRSQETAKQMMQTTIPKEHQALGRKAKGFDRKKWDESAYALRLL
jgi:predicted NAD-dependent protein-ADP-ribosyltransferase YbiA (DUF1768 family)